MKKVKVKSTTLQDYLNAVRFEQSYVGGDGCIEHHLWLEIERCQKELKLSGIDFPTYDLIDCSQEDWV
jgi:hypothetical protein